MFLVTGNKCDGKHRDDRGEDCQEKSKGERPTRKELKADYVVQVRRRNKKRIMNEGTRRRKCSD